MDKECDSVADTTAVNEHCCTLKLVTLKGVQHIIKLGCPMEKACSLFFLYLANAIYLCGTIIKESILFLLYSHHRTENRRAKYNFAKIE